MKSKIILGAAVFLLASTAALAGNVTSKSLASTITTQGSFTETFEWTTANVYNSSLANLYVTGLTSNFSALTLTVFDADNTLVTTPHSVNVGALQTGTTNLKATFLDSAVPWNLAANTTYKVVVSGTSTVLNSNIALTGVYFKGATAGPVTPVPEPETYAMLLAGLGLVGTMVRRRKGTQA